MDTTNISLLKTLLEKVDRLSLFQIVRNKSHANIQDESINIYLELLILCYVNEVRVRELSMEQLESLWSQLIPNLSDRFSILTIWNSIIRSNISALRELQLTPDEAKAFKEEFDLSPYRFGSSAMGKYALVKNTILASEERECLSAFVDPDTIF